MLAIRLIVGPHREHRLPVRRPLIARRARPIVRQADADLLGQVQARVSTSHGTAEGEHAGEEAQGRLWSGHGRAVYHACGQTLHSYRRGPIVAPQLSASEDHRPCLPSSGSTDSPAAPPRPSAPSCSNPFSTASSPSTSPTSPSPPSAS